MPLSKNANESLLSAIQDEESSCRQGDDPLKCAWDAACIPDTSLFVSHVDWSSAAPFVSYRLSVDGKWPPADQLSETDPKIPVRRASCAPTLDVDASGTGAATDRRGRRSLLGGLFGRKGHAVADSSQPESGQANLAVEGDATLTTDRKISVDVKQGTVERKARAFSKGYASSLGVMENDQV